MKPIENINDKCSNFNAEQKTIEKGKTTQSKNKSNTEHFRAVLEQVAKLAAERTKKND